MYNNFQTQVCCTDTCRTLTQSAALIITDLPMKFGEHLFNLLNQFVHPGRITEFIKQDSISFNLRHIQVKLVRINDGLKQFLNDIPAMFNFRLIDKPGETADIRYKYEPCVVHKLN